MSKEIFQNKKSVLALIAASILLLGLGIWIGRTISPSAAVDSRAKSEDDAGKATIWTCSMHPQIRQPEPGKCPICAMDLIPAAAETEEKSGPRMMSMSEESMRLAEVETTRVERRFVDVEVPLVGKVDYDERRLKTIAAWVPGRLDRLFVDYTGVPVRKGDHLVEMYSPELYAAQEELLQAIKAVKNLEGSESDIVQRSTKKTVDATREKLRLLGLSSEQIAQVEKRNTASATIQINAPVGGIVVEKKMKEGAYVQTGMPIYTVADLSMVWVILDAYESEIAWLRYGQEVMIKTEAYGDRTFDGWISFIDPVLNPQTRTIKVRVVVKNPGGILRPNMFARAIVKARVADEDQIVTRNLSNKWICPMHPEVIKDNAGACDICGMHLVKAENLGYVAQDEAKAPLVVPASAVLTTGERAIVYMRVPDKERPTFEGVEVRVGPQAGDFYVIRSGLKEGQEVVTHGNFKIDSALQLLAKPSMMNPHREDPVSDGHTDSAMSSMTSNSENNEKPAPLITPIAFLLQLTPIYDAYLKAQQALAGDDEKEARAALDQLAHSLAKVDMSLVKNQAHMQWMELSRQLGAALEHRMHMPGIDGVRKIFLKVSRVMVHMEKSFGHAGKATHRIAFCPMADGGKGAEWLQAQEAVSNPYYGESMLRCGEIRQTIAGADTREKQHDRHK